MDGSEACSNMPAKFVAKAFLISVSQPPMMQILSLILNKG
jgi:hypothetical protein